MHGKREVLNNEPTMIYINDDIEGFDFEAALPLLSDQRRKEALRYTFELGRKLNAAAYLLLRQGLKEEYGITDAPVFEFGEKGKPFFLGNSDLHFNLSHCRTAAVCALSRHPVGIDVEHIRPLRESVVRYTMNDAEISRIMSAENPDLEFVKLWTQKEAVLKLRGTGITDDIKEALCGEERPHTVVNLEKGYVFSVTGGDETMVFKNANLGIFQ